MQKLIEITEHPHLQVSSNILKYEKPDYVYIPIPKNSTLLIKKDAVLSIGTPIINHNGTPITSPISGKVVSIRKMHHLNIITDFIEIMNDFEERKVINPTIKRNIHNIKKEVLDKLLKMNFMLDLNNQKTIILNCIDDDPYTFTENFYLFLNYEGYLELLDKLAKIYNFSRIIICVKSSNSENINKLMECLGMYPNIILNIVPNLYLLGNDKILLNHLNIPEKEALVIKASKFYHISNLLLRNRQITNKLITISGSCVNNPSIVRVKLGTKIKDVLDNFIKYESSNCEYIINSIMDSKNVSIEDLVITEDLQSLLIVPKKDTPPEEKCLNCGECLNICPVGINPILLKDATYKKLVEEKCLKCGLCSYICPTYINFNKYMEDNNE